MAQRSSTARRPTGQLTLLTPETTTRVLVIDDDPAAGQVLHALLCQRSYEVEVVITGRDGLARFAEQPADVVLVDLRLPDIHGLNIVEELHRLAPECAILVISGEVDVHLAVEAQRRGAWDLVLKPVDASVLYHAIDRARERQMLMRRSEAYQEHLERQITDRSAELREANDELRAANGRLQQLLALTGNLSPLNDYDQLAGQLLAHFALDLNATSGRFYDVEPHALRLVHVIESAEKPDLLPFPLPTGSFLERVLKIKKPLLLTRAQTPDMTLGDWDNVDAGSLVAFPFIGERGKVMAILLLRRVGTIPFRGQDLKIGSVIASFCSGAMRAARATVSLRESEQRYRDLVHSARSIMLRLDAEGRIRFFNEFGQRFFGYAESALIGRHVVGTLVPASADQRDAIAQLLGRIKDHPEEYGSTEQECRCRDGRRVWIQWTHRALLDAAGGLAGILSVGTDITDRKRMELELGEERDRLLRFMDTSPIAIVVFDRTGAITQANPQAKTLLGALNEAHRDLRWDRPGTAWTDWNGKPLRPDQMPLARVRQTRKPFSDLRLALARPENRRILLTVNCAPIFDDQGDVSGMIAALQDVTQAIALEDRLRQAQKMETVGELAGGVAHDFNNLLMPIIGFSEMALEELTEDNPLYERISVIHQAGERAKNLTRQLLAFSRKQILEIALIDLNQVVRGFEKMLRRTIREDIDLQIMPDPTLGRTRADAAQVEQVLLNLCINAQHAMPEGGKLIVETANIDLDDAYANSHPDAKAGPHVMLAVSDTGTGMDKETLKHIFEPFFTTKKAGEGTGLGLAMVYGIVRQHNGSIWVYSEVGKGTTFKIYLPRLEGEATSETAEKIDPRRFAGSETVVVAEDDDLVRSAACTLLATYGYTVIESDDPTRCIQQVEAHAGSVDLLLSDVVMPLINGRELYHRLRELRPDLRVVFMSGYTEKAIAQYGVLDPGVRFIQKPFNTLSLLQAVRAALDETPGVQV